MIYYIITNINTPAAQIYCNMDGFPRPFRTYKKGMAFIAEWKMEAAKIVAECSDERNYLV